MKTLKEARQKVIQFGAATRTSYIVPGKKHMHKKPIFQGDTTPQRANRLNLNEQKHATYCHVF